MIEGIIKSLKETSNLALFGTWGSGKSTIVKKVADKLGVEAIIFDFWKSSGDKLKRVFLETIIKEAKLNKNKDKSFTSLVDYLIEENIDTPLKKKLWVY